MIVMNVSDIQQTILIVDDLPNNIKTVANYLRYEGLRIMTAQSGEDGIKRAIRFRPDLILLDILMPDVDGFEVCQRLKMNAETKDIPIIFMTSLSDEEHKVKGFEVGAVDYVTKPIEHIELLARIKAHLRISQLTRHLAESNKTPIDAQDASIAAEKEYTTKSQFSAQVSDELLPSLQEIIRSAQLMCDDDTLSTNQRKLIESIHKHSGHLLDRLHALAR